MYVYTRTFIRHVTIWGQRETKKWLRKDHLHFMHNLIFEFNVCIYSESLIPVFCIHFFYIFKKCKYFSGFLVLLLNTFKFNTPCSGLLVSVLYTVTMCDSAQKQLFVVLRFYIYKVLNFETLSNIFWYGVIPERIVPTLHLHLHLSPGAKLAHRASTCVFHRFLSCAAVCTSLQDCHPALDLSFSTVRARFFFDQLYPL